MQKHATIMGGAGIALACLMVGKAFLTFVCILTGRAMGTRPQTTDTDKARIHDEISPETFLSPDKNLSNN